MRTSYKTNSPTQRKTNSNTSNTNYPNTEPLDEQWKLGKDAAKDRKGEAINCAREAIDRNRIQTKAELDK